MADNLKMELARIVFENHYQSVLKGIESTQKFRDHVIATVSCGGIALAFAIIDRIGLSGHAWLLWLYLLPLLCWGANILMLIYSAECSRKSGCAMANLLGSGHLTQSDVANTDAYNLRTRRANTINIIVLAVGIVSFSLIVVATISSSVTCVNEYTSSSTLEKTSGCVKNVVTIENSTIDNSVILK